MSIKTIWKRNVILTLAILAILMSVLNPALTAFADMDKVQQEFDKQSGEFLEDAEEAGDIVNILEKDAKANPDPKRDSISFVMKRLLYPGVYVNDVRDGVVSNSIIKEKSELLDDNKFACVPGAPNNLIDHNCNIPNFTTGLIQNIADPFMTPFSNAGKSSSYSVFGLGVPSNIPGGTVPIKPENRTNTYTALELFGYNLQLTSYNGEWDQIVVSNEARMLSNFGVIDKITLVGTGLWNSVSAGVGEMIENFSFNPIRWFGNIAKAYTVGASAGINTVVDTSELNVIATNGWKRPRLDSSLYNVYVLSDAEVIRETARNYFEIFNAELGKNAESSDDLQEVISMNPEKAFEDTTNFSYDKNMETEESKKKRKKAQDKRDGEKSHNKNERFLEKSQGEHLNKPYKADIISPLTKVPKKVYYTEGEQMGFWEEDPEVAAILGTAKGNGLVSGSASSYDSYEDMMNDWGEAYDPYFKVEFDALGETVADILENTDASVFQEHPELDPKQGISRYACTNDDGSIKRKESGSVEYLYEKNNDKDSETLNPNCKQARAPIGGGLLGTGWKDSIKDTRHISNVTDDGLAITHKVSNVTVSAFRSLNSFIAKVTNIILDLSFSPLLEKLGIDEIVSKLVEGFRDTVFFPLAGLVAAVGALMLFVQVLRAGSAWQLLGSLAITIVIFIAGAAFLLHPSATLKVVDEIPTKIDTIIADAVLVDNDESSYCSTGDDSDGIRSAQCNVWGAMVFEPWVHLQFGTGSDNLYAKGKGNGKGEMKNDNKDLVGDAAVNMGGGKVENNWALYQLSKTKAGTINSVDKSTPLGMVDKDLYRLVDLQAGPDGAADSDPRYWNTWNGSNINGGWVFLTLLQAVMMSIAIGGLGIAKIEVSFMFSISIIFLPIMLLYALLPKGQIKLKQYLSNLVSLLLKRVIITVMLAVLLRVITMSYAASETLETGALIGIFVSLATIIYRKELLTLITATEGGGGLLGGDTGQVKEAISETIPTYVKQRYSIAKANVRGASAGFIGGAMGERSHKNEIKKDRKSIRRQLDRLNRINPEDMTEEQINRKKALEERDKGHDYAAEKRKKMTKADLEELEEESNKVHKEILQNEVKMNKLLSQDNEEENGDEISRLVIENDRLNEERERISIRAAGGERAGTSVLSQAIKGSAHSRSVIGRTAERKIRSEGYAPLTAYGDVKKVVYAEGAQKITSQKETVEHDVYKEVLSESESRSSKSSYSLVRDKAQGDLATDPKIQKQVRELADKRRRFSKQDEYIATTPDAEDIEKAASIVDKRRRKEKFKLAIKNPKEAFESHKDDVSESRKDMDKVSRTDSIVREIDEYLRKGGHGVIDEKGNTVVKDRDSQSENEDMNNMNQYKKELNDLIAEIREMDEDKAIKLASKREELDEALAKLTSNYKESEEDE